MPIPLLEDFIKQIDVAKVNSLMDTLIEQNQTCEDHNCCSCQLQAKLKESELILSDTDLMLLIVVGRIHPSALFIKGFMLAYHLLQVKELEELNAIT